MLVIRFIHLYASRNHLISVDRRGEKEGIGDVHFYLAECERVYICTRPS